MASRIQVAGMNWSYGDYWELVGISVFSWAGNGKFDLSPKRICEEIGISDKGVRLARKELEDIGCLKLEEGKTNVYVFTPDAIL